MAATGCGSAASEKKIEAARKAAAEQAILVNASDVTTAVRRRLESGISFTGELKPIDEVDVTAHFDGDLQSVLVREGTRVREGPVDGGVQARATCGTQRSAAEAGLLAAQVGPRLGAERGAPRPQAPRGRSGRAQRPRGGGGGPHGRGGAGARGAGAERAGRGQRRSSSPSRRRSPAGSARSSSTPATGPRIDDPLFTVVRTDTLELSATIPSEALGRVRRGTPISIRVDAFPGESFDGVVDRINPATEPGTRQIRIYTRVPNPDGRLVGGLFASGRVVDRSKEDAVTAPSASCGARAPTRSSTGCAAARASRAVVQTGLLDEEQGIIELIGAVRAGDSLLSGVVPGLRDGARVRVIKATAPTAAPPASGGTRRGTSRRDRPAGTGRRPGRGTR